MRLRDTVNVIAGTVTEDEFGNQITTWDPPTVVASDVPAEVSFTTVATFNDLGRQALIEELRAIIEPRAFDPVLNRLQWRGSTYQTDGPPMIRRRNGADHHLTIPLKLVTG